MIRAGGWWPLVKIEPPPPGRVGSRDAVDPPAMKRHCNIDNLQGNATVANRGKFRHDDRIDNHRVARAEGGCPTSSRSISRTRTTPILALARPGADPKRIRDA